MLLVLAVSSCTGRTLQPCPQQILTLFTAREPAHRKLPRWTIALFCFAPLYSYACCFPCRPVPTAPSPPPPLFCLLLLSLSLFFFGDVVDSRPVLECSPVLLSLYTDEQVQPSNSVRLYSFLALARSKVRAYLLTRCVASLLLSRLSSRRFPLLHTAVKPLGFIPEHLRLNPIAGTSIMY